MEGCVLITDAMSKLDPTLPDGPHPWRDGRRVVKEGVRLYIEGTDTLAGRYVLVTFSLTYKFTKFLLLCEVL